jgi:hypothetical protein
MPPFICAELYVAPPRSSVPRPSKELKGFAKIFLQPGESRKAEILLRPGALAFYDVTTKKWKAETGEYEIHVGSTSREVRLRSKLKLATDRLFYYFCASDQPRTEPEHETHLHLSPVGHLPLCQPCPCG